MMMMLMGGKPVAPHAWLSIHLSICIKSGRRKIKKLKWKKRKKTKNYIEESYNNRRLLADIEKKYFVFRNKVRHRRSHSHL
jgi:hypothetical protein